WSPALTSGTGVFDPLVDATGVYTYTVLGAGLCVDDSATVTVTVDIAPEAGTNGSINYCSTDTPTDLFLELGGSPDAGGTWSPALTSGTGVFDPAVDTANTYTYVVTGGGCPDATSEVVVTVDTAPNAGTNGTIDLCTDNASVDLFSSLTGSPDAGGVWSPALASGTGMFDPAVDLAGIYTYTVAPTGACLIDATATVTVILNTAPEAGTNGMMAYCSTDAATDLYANLGGSPDMGGTWSPALTSGTGMFDPAVDAVGTYTYTVAGLGVCVDDTAEVVVTIDTAPDAGTDGTADFCTDNPTADLFSSLGGTPDAGGVWSPALTSGTGVFDPAIDLAGIYTYTVSPIGACAVDATATVTVTVDTAPEAGVDGTMAYCSTDIATDLFTNLGGSPDMGGVWSPALTSGTGVFNPAVDAAGIYTYTVTGVGVCADDLATVTVTVDLAPDAGLDGLTEFCTSDATIDLITFLGGTPDTTGTWSPALTSGTGIFDPSLDVTGIYTYTVSNGVCTDATATVDVTVYTAANAGTDNSITLCSNSPTEDLYALLGTADLGGTWSPALTSGTGIFDPAIDVAGAYTYTITGTGVCADDTATVTVSIDAEPNAGTDNTIEFCSTDTTFDIFTLLGGAPDTTGTWSPALASGTGVFDPATDTGGIYTYTVSNGVCTDDTATIDVTLYQAPDAGTNGTVEFCTSDLGDDLFKYLGGTPDATGTWSPALTSGTGMFDPAIDLGGIYTYTVLGTGTCADISAEVVVTVDTAPDAGLDADAFFCMSEPTIDLFTLLGGTPDTGGIWSPTMASGDGNFDPSTDAAGDYTYTVSGQGACADISAVISVSLSEAPTIESVEISDFSDNNIVTVNVEGAVSGTSFGIGDYEYSLDGVSFQSNNIFDEVAPGNYVLTVRDANGCLPPAYRSISIVGAGNYFTPNNDGNNDTWNIINLTDERLVNPSDGVSIFDRYGKMLATLNASSIVGWDGNYNGNPLPSGDYWYSVLVKDSSGNPVLKRGHFSLVRR
ncbi:MAG: T9SS type B sorting domain-containing protein, partial [Urechidicola sp.]|nr:T9SS type B sorting domain-containing protein [Urechidicola sp.]